MNEALPFLAGRQETAKRIKTAIDSREWWILVPSADPLYSGVVVEIEDRYYSGAASGDFIAILGKCRVGLVSVYLARKSRMNAGELWLQVKDRAALPVTVRELEKRDIVFLSSWEHSDLLMAGLAELIHGH